MLKQVLRKISRRSEKHRGTATVFEPLPSIYVDPDIANRNAWAKAAKAARNKAEQLSALTTAIDAGRIEQFARAVAQELKLVDCSFEEASYRDDEVRGRRNGPQRR